MGESAAPWLRFARLAWLAFVGSALFLFTLAVPVRQLELARTFGNMSPAQELVLSDLGVSGQQHAGAVLFVEIGVFIAFLTVALLIFWRRSNDWVAIFVSASLVSYIVWISPAIDTLARVGPGWHFTSNLIQAVGTVCAVTFFYIFPDGRFVPRWTRYLPLAFVSAGLAWLAFPQSPFNLADPFRLPIASFVVMMSCWFLGMGTQVYRYVRVASPVQKQQTKMVLFGVAVAILSYLTFGFDRFALPLLAEPRYANVVYDLIGVPIFLLTVIVIPIAFAVSILRYRLWDIDLIINRALVYATLTAVLGGLYTTSITLSQRLFVALTGERSDAAIVLTTLIVASAFTPARAQLQVIVDRYLKQPPDPAESLRAFEKQVRSVIEVIDTPQLTKHALEESLRAFEAVGGAVYMMQQYERMQLVHVSGEWAQIEGLGEWMEHNGVRYGRIALGPRRNGRTYSESDRAIFREVATDVARAIALGRHLGLGAPAVTQPLREAARVSGLRVDSR
jgi:hypothetical protein